MSKGKRRTIAVLRSRNYWTAGPNDLKSRTIEIKYNTKAIMKYVYNEYAFWFLDCQH
jgi:hypothetical protein